MTKLIIIVLFAVAAVVAWVWIRHRRGLAQRVNRPMVEAKPRTDDSQTDPPTGAPHQPTSGVYAPAQSREIIPTASEITESASVPTETVEVAVAMVRVRDHGQGISAEGARRLFKPFSKSAHEAAHTAPGVGVGLALCRRLSRSMGGDLRLDALVKDGACFVLTLPVSPADGLAPNPATL